MKKVLFVSHTANFAKFNYPFMKWFKEKGWKVDYASDGKEDIKACDNCYRICFERSPFKLNNVKAYMQLKEVLKKNKYDIIHCHTPMGGVIARLAARQSRKQGTKVIYTAHGFHFYRGASLINWLIYYPVEKLLARDADCLVTINEEDYRNAVSKKFPSRKIVKINGVGVDLTRFRAATQMEKVNLRHQYSFNPDDFILVVVAEINKNKNQEFLIENLAYLQEHIPSIKVLIVGTGPRKNQCEFLVKQHKLEKQVSFLGYRRDVDQLLRMSDILISTSYREGLAVNIIEGMASGIPVVCSNTRGQRDLIEDRINGRVYKIGDCREFCECVLDLYNCPDVALEYSKYSIEKSKRFSVDEAVQKMALVYKDFMS